MQATQAIPSPRASHVGINLSEACFHVGQIDALVGDEMRLHVLAQPPIDDQLVAAGPLAMGREPEFLVLNPPRAEGEELLVARRPSELLPLADMDDLRAQHDWLADAVHERPLACPNDAINRSEHRAEELRIGPALDSILQHVGFHPAALVRMLQRDDRRIALRVTQAVHFPLKRTKAFFAGRVFVEETHRKSGRATRAFGDAAQSQHAIARRGQRPARGTLGGESFIERAPFVGTRQKAEAEHGAVSDGNGAHGEDARRRSVGTAAGLGG